MSVQSESNKRIAKNTLLLYVRMLFTMAISLYTSRIVLDTLGAVDYGIYNVVGGFVTMFAIISGAMTTATQRFLSYELGRNKAENVKSVFSTAVIIHLILALIIIVCGETVGLWFINNYMNLPQERIFAANCVFQFSLLTFVINVISVPYNAAIIAYERMKAFAYVSIIEVSLKLLIVYLLLMTNHDKLILYSMYIALIAITIRIIYGIYVNKNFEECRIEWVWNKKYGKKVMSFVSWNLIGSVAGVTKEQGINIILNMFFGATVNAARGIAYQVMGAINSFVSNFQLALNPQIIKHYAKGEYNDMFKIVFRGSKFSYLLLLTLSLPIIIETPFVLNLWLKEVPNYTVIFLRLVLIIALIDSLSGTLITSMHASGKVRDYQIIVGGISLLTLPIVYILFKMNFSPYYAMYVGIFISITCHIARLLLLNKTIGLPILNFLREVTLKIFLVSVSSLVISLTVYLNLPINLYTFFVVCFSCVITTLLLSYCIALDKNEKNYIIKVINKIRKKNNECC